MIQTVCSMVFINYALHYFEFPHCYLFNLPITLGIYWWGIKPSIDFSNGKITAKELKMQSYKHFTLVFCIFIICSLLSRNRGKGLNLKERNTVKMKEDNLFNIYL